MNLNRIFAGIVLVLAIYLGRVVHVQTENFKFGAVVFVALAVGAGILHNRGDRQTARAAR